MARDLDGYIEWKKKQLEKDGYVFDDIPPEEPEYYTEEELDETRRQAAEIMDQLTAMWDETFERWKKEDAEGTSQA